MLKKKDLPLIELTINPDRNSFVQAISLVEFPAIESNFIAFSQNQINFKSNDEKRELIGLAMIPNQYIYRNDSESGEYACVFSKETIREIAQIFAQKGFFNNTNIEHSLIPADSFIFQSYLVDLEKGINPPTGLEKAVDGSWVVGVKVLNDSVWDNIKAGKVKGFSVEGIFALIDTKTTINLSNHLPIVTDLEKALTGLIDLEILMNNY